MEKRLVFDRITGQFAAITEEDILQRLDCVWNVAKSKHHKRMTINDLIKMFGMEERLIGNTEIVDKENIHVTTEHDYEFPEISGEVQPVMLLLYKCRPCYETL